MVFLAEFITPILEKAMQSWFGNCQKGKIILQWTLIPGAETEISIYCLGPESQQSTGDLLASVKIPPGLIQQLPNLITEAIRKCA